MVLYSGMLRDWLRRHFIPHQENNYKPHVLQETAVVGMMCLIIITFAVANLQSFIWTASDWMVSTILPAVIVSDTNEEREQGGLVLLSRNNTLDQAAQLKAEDMARGSYFSHYSPTGTSPWFWFKEAGYNYVHAGENLAVHFTDSSEVVDAWMNSPTHRANIMDAKFHEIGIGVAKGTYEGYDTIFVVQLFGTAAAPAEVTVASVVEESELPSEDVSEEPEIILNDTTNPSVAGAEATEEKVVQTQTEIPTTTTQTQEIKMAVEETVDITDEGTVVVSSYVSTSTGGIPANIKPTSGETKAPWLAFATQPHKVVQVMYVLIGLFVAISLIMSIVIEMRRQQPVQMVYGFGLLILMLVLFHAHLSISGGVLIV